MSYDAVYDPGKRPLSSESAEAEKVVPRPEVKKRLPQPKAATQESQKTLHKKVQKLKETDSPIKHVTAKRLLGTKPEKSPSSKRKRDESAIKAEGLLQVPQATESSEIPRISKRVKIEEKKEKLGDAIPKDAIPNSVDTTTRLLPKAEIMKTTQQHIESLNDETRALIERTMALAAKNDPTVFAEHKKLDDEYQVLLVKICEFLKTVPSANHEKAEEACFKLVTALNQAFQELEAKTLLPLAQKMLELLAQPLTSVDMAKIKESLMTYFSTKNLHESRVSFVMESYGLAHSPIGSFFQQHRKDLQAEAKALEESCSQLAAKCTLSITTLLLEGEKCHNGFKELQATASENWEKLQTDLAAFQTQTSTLLEELARAKQLLSFVSFMATLQLFSSASVTLDPKDPTVVDVGKALEKQHLYFLKDDGKVEFRIAPSHFTFLPEMAQFDQLKSKLFSIQNQLQITFETFKSANASMQNVLCEWNGLIESLYDFSSLVEANHLATASSLVKELLTMQAKANSHLQACVDEQQGKNLFVPAYKIALRNFEDATKFALRDCMRELAASYQAERMELSALLHKVQTNKSLDQEDYKLLGYAAELSRYLVNELQNVESRDTKLQKEIQELQRIQSTANQLLKQHLEATGIEKVFDTLPQQRAEIPLETLIYVQALLQIAMQDESQLQEETKAYCQAIQKNVSDLSSAFMRGLIEAKALPEALFALDKRVGQDNYRFCLFRLAERSPPLTSAKKSRFWMQRDIQTRHYSEMSERWKTFFGILFPAMQLSAMALGFLADVDARATKLQEKRAVEQETQSRTIMSNLLEDKLDDRPRWTKELVDSLARKGKLTEAHAKFLTDLLENVYLKAVVTNFTRQDLLSLCENLGMSQGAKDNVVRFIRGPEPTLAHHTITRERAPSPISDVQKKVLAPDKVETQGKEAPVQAYYPSQVGTILSPSIKVSVETITNRPLDSPASKSSDLLLYEMFLHAENGNAKELDWVIQNIRSGWSPRERQALLFLRKALKQALDTAKNANADAKVIETLEVHLNELRQTNRYATTQSTQATESLTTYVQLSPEQQAHFQNPKIALLTAYTLDNPNRVRLSKAVSHNQREYAKRCGYQYVEHERNLAVEKTLEGTELAWEPYWAKIVGILQILEAKEQAIGDKPEWIVWLDDDAIIGNKEIRFEDIILQHTRANPDIHVIITQDSMSHQIPSIPLNSAVLIIKNNQWSREFFQTVWGMRHVNVPGQSYTYGNCKNQVCLHEQQAITDIYQSDPEVRRHLKIISQRDEKTRVGMNTFSRQTHYDVKRGFTVNYDNDLPSSKAQTGDFIIQCTGLATQGSLPGSDEVRNLREECVMRELQKSS